MRVIRSLFLLLSVSMAAAGCARQPVAYTTYPPVAAGPAAYGGVAPGGIDNVVYGGGRYAQPAYMPPPAYGPPPAASVALAPPPRVPVAFVPPPRIPVVVPAAYAPVGPVGPGGQPGYTLDSGDRLRVVVFGQEGLTNAYSVDAGGSIDMPLIGPVFARGATTDELAARISARLRDGFIREPHVAVEVEAYRPFFILGEVTQPGQYPYVANMTAETAVAISGGFTPRAFRRSVVVNRNDYGRQVRMAVPLTFPLRPGDTVNVQERWF
jgi:polysaccharide biosynthesis/export protein